MAGLSASAWSIDPIGEMSIAMKLLIAYIQNHRLDNVRRALELIEGLPGMTITRVTGFGREKAMKPRPERAELIDYTEHTRIELFLRDEIVVQVSQAIREAARTGQTGDGKIFVMNLESAVRIRTGEEGEEAV